MNEYNINPKYKPVEEIQNHLIQLEPMTYRDSLHLAYLALKERDMDEDIKREAIAHLSRLFLRDIV